MANGDDRRIPKALSFDSMNSIIRQVVEMIYKQEGRKGPVTIRDSLQILGNLLVTGTPKFLRPFCDITNSAALPIPNTTTTVLTFDTEVSDTTKMHFALTNPSRITISTPGKYLITSRVRFASNAGGNLRQVNLRLNGSVVFASDTRPNNTTPNAVDIALSAIKLFAPGDYVETTVFQDSGGILNINANAVSPFFSAIQLSD